MKYTHILSAIIVCQFFTLTLFAQTTFKNSCATEVPGQNWESELAALIQAEIQSGNSKKQAALYTIPVIIHVVHNGEAVGVYPNISQAQLVSQVRVLNEDFGGIGYNSWNYPATAFANWAVSQALPQANLDALGRVKIADCNVQFCLATKDTLGNTLPEPGINRINRFSMGWNQDPASFNSNVTFKNYVDNTIKPASIWNVKRYLNIWLTDVNIGTVNLLGYATFPLLTTLPGLPNAIGTASTDGCWCYTKAFGSNVYYPSGTYYNGNEKGRTASHEVGHWLGLRHIWGDANCATDYCNDTPPATASNFGIPAYPFKAGQCMGNAPDGEMFMNIMDYPDDIAKYMFSPDQAMRVQTTMANSPYRKFMGTHNLCSVAQVAATASFNLGATGCVMDNVLLKNSSNGTPLPNYTWQANGPGTATFNPSNSNAISVMFPVAGNYTITLTANNGSNSTITKTVNVGGVASLSLSAAASIVCLYDRIGLSAQGVGATGFVWKPFSIISPTANYSAPDTTGAIVFTCVASGAFSCRKTSTIEIEVVSCVGLTDATAENKGVRIFPNPAGQTLYIKYNNIDSRPVAVEIKDAIGRVVFSKSLPVQSKENVIPLDLPPLTSGVYAARVINSKGEQTTLKFIKE